MKPTFLKYDKPLLTCMVQADNPDRIKSLIDASLPEGAEAFGMQFCRLKEEYRKEEIYRELFSYTRNKPVYITNYRYYINEQKTDEQLADELLKMAGYGATLCDVMGDLYDKHPEELTTDKLAVQKQMELIDRLHEQGAEILMSSHTYKYMPQERVLEIAREHQRRGADICKIVTGAETMEEQIENLKTVRALKEELRIPFLFLSVGKSEILRRIGGTLGCCMYLCVQEHDEFSTETQPLLKHLKCLRDEIKI